MNLTKKLTKSIIGVSLLSLIGYNNLSKYSYNPILNRPPVAKAVFSYSVPFNQDPSTSVYPNSRVVLDGSCSYDLDGDHINYVWSMNKIPTDSKLKDNDILNRYNSNPIFFPDVAGDYTLELKVTDERGESNEDFITINIKDNKFPRLEINPSQNLTGLEGEVIKFKAYDPVERDGTYEITNSEVLKYYFNKTSGEFSWTTNCSDSGIYTLDIKAKYADGSESLTYKISLFVEENPDCITKIEKPRVETKKARPKVEIKKEKPKKSFFKKLFEKNR